MHTNERILYIQLFRHVPLFRFWELLSCICTHFLQVIVCLLSLARGRWREQRRGRRGRVREGGGKKWKRKGKIRGEYMWLAFSIGSVQLPTLSAYTEATYQRHSQPTYHCHLFDRLQYLTVHLLSNFKTLQEQRTKDEGHIIKPLTSLLSAHPGVLVMVSHGRKPSTFGDSGVTQRTFHMHTRQDVWDLAVTCSCIRKWIIWMPNSS